MMSIFKKYIPLHLDLIVSPENSPQISDTLTSDCLIREYKQIESDYNINR